MSCDQVFKVLYQNLGTYLDYSTIANHSNVRKCMVSYKISRIKRRQGIELGFKYKKINDKILITVALLRCDNESYNPLKDRTEE